MLNNVNKSMSFEYLYWIPNVNKWQQKKKKNSATNNYIDSVKPVNIIVHFINQNFLTKATLFHNIKSKSFPFFLVHLFTYSLY